MMTTKQAIEYWKAHGIEILNSLPDGWKVNEGSTTAPRGYSWVSNGKSIFSKDYRHAIISNKALYRKVRKSEVPDWLFVGNVVRIGVYACKILKVDCNEGKVAYSSFEEDYNRPFVVDMKLFIHQYDITTRKIEIPDWLRPDKKVWQEALGKVQTVATLHPSFSEDGFAVETKEQPGEWFMPSAFRKARWFEINKPLVTSIY